MMNILERGSVAACILLLSASPALAVDFCNNGNIAAVYNHPRHRVTPCTIDRPAHIAKLFTYHWNDGSGVSWPGTIGLRNTQTGEVYGPFRAEGTDGQGGVPNANWTAYVDLDVPPGDYTVFDSDSSTWSWNEESGGYGIMTVSGEYADEDGHHHHRPHGGGDD